ncbi:ubiquitin carboxyl-terminal hydrolase 7-like [Sparus aurata]|uniref:ubiquitin carboxyl-terminal hydrolase 7-like n=1 Tax=Sparus aurata TaxID=8175 RepID=UPI0011C0E449|nr:ubiquitin carboxyl-terminal hydrolase 7-like [Sparus aurata]
MPKANSKRDDRRARAGNKGGGKMVNQKNKNESKDRGRGQMGQSDDVTPPQRCHHGLYNQGATCYLNSVLQVLFMTTEIHDRLNQQPDQKLRKIFMDLKRKTCGTENITKSLKIQNVHEQRDAAECLQEILHHISPEASEVSTY